MGVRRIIVLTCDGPGCDFRHEFEQDNSGDYRGVMQTEISFSGRALFSGLLCDRCQTVMETRVNNALVGSVQ